MNQIPFLIFSKNLRFSQINLYLQVKAQLSFCQVSSGNSGCGVGEDDHGAVRLSATVGEGGDLEADLIVRAPDWYGRQHIGSRETSREHW